MVYVFDPKQWGDDEDSWTYQTLKPGAEYDIKLRKLIQEVNDLQCLGSTR